MKEDEGIAILETVFHDTLTNSRRIAPFRDFHTFTMASLGEKVVSDSRSTTFSLSSWDIRHVLLCRVHRRNVYA